MFIIKYIEHLLCQMEKCREQQRKKKKKISVLNLNTTFTLREAKKEN